MKILIMGLDGSGKTWLGKRIAEYYGVPLWDADVIRTIYNNFDFSDYGRKQQVLRMRKLAECDPISVSCFICPSPSLMKTFSPDKIIWMDTIQKGKYENTNKLFTSPKKYDVRIQTYMNEKKLNKVMRNNAIHDLFSIMT
jgi:adenylylsulfate kinase